MFNSLTGTVTGKFPQTLYLDTGGIEWDITVPDSSLDVFSPVGSRTRVFVWMYHREDAMKLFGFASAEDRSVFVDLMKVDGVGPKAAVKILSGITAREFAAILENEDMARLEKMPGVGKKTAQKMLLTLKGKLALSPADGLSPAAKTSRWQDVIAALVNMGYDKKAAEEAVERIAAETDASLPDQEKETAVFRRAIVELSSL